MIIACIRLNYSDGKSGPDKLEFCKATDKCICYHAFWPCFTKILLDGGKATYMIKCLINSIYICVCGNIHEDADQREDLPLNIPYILLKLIRRPEYAEVYTRVSE